MLAVMALLTPIELSDGDKLAILQRLDRFRRWRSLEEKRYCLCCNRLITGSQIQVVGGTRGTGPLRIICPTQGCYSIPMDWVLPTDEVLSKISMLQTDPQNIVAPKHRDRVRESSIRARLREFATHFRQSA